MLPPVAHVDAPRLLRLPEVVSMVGIKRSQIYRLEKKGEFPRRVAIGPRSVAWPSSSVRAWIDARPRKALGGSE